MECTSPPDIYIAAALWPQIYSDEFAYDVVFLVLFTLSLVSAERTNVDLDALVRVGRVIMNVKVHVHDEPGLQHHSYLLLVVLQRR